MPFPGLLLERSVVSWERLRRICANLFAAELASPVFFQQLGMERSIDLIYKLAAGDSLCDSDGKQQLVVGEGFNVWFHGFCRGGRICCK